MMFKAYFAYISKSFQNSMVYRIDTLLNVLNTVITIFVYVAIWTSLFKFTSQMDGYNLKMVTTHFVISLGLSTIFLNMTSEISWKVNSGEIVNDLLKPVNYIAFHLAKVAGYTICRILIQFIPAFILCFFLIGMALPSSFVSFFIFRLSTILGFLIYFFIDFIISVMAFWFFHVFFLEQFKNALITILSGALFPIWFLPKELAAIIKFTPFESIYYVPISLYLNTLTSFEVGLALLKQGIWVIGLATIAHFLWKIGSRKLVIQGG